MKLTNVEKKEKSTVELSITVEKEEFAAALDKAYKQNVGSITVPGFRKGKAPRKMIEKLYGAEVFYGDAMEIAFPDAYEKAVAVRDALKEAMPEAEFCIYPLSPAFITQGGPGCFAVQYVKMI